MTAAQVLDLASRGEAAAFLAALDPSASAWTFQTFDDNKARSDPRMLRTLHGSLDQHWPELARLNAAGAGVYVTVQETDGTGRKASNVRRVRAVFHEDDGAGFLGDCAVPPAIVVESSPGKFHRYWPADGLSADDFAGIMARMVTDHGSDPRAKDIARVLRLPGTWHNKGSQPQRCKLVSVSSGGRLWRAEALAAFPPIKRELTATPATATHDFELREVMRALYTLPADSRDDWLAAGMALHNAFNGGQQGFEIWDAWSQTTGAGNYVEQLQRQTWDAFAVGRDRGTVTLGTLFHLAAKHGFSGRYIDPAEGFEVVTAPDPIAADTWEYDETEASEAALPRRPWLVPGLLLREKVTTLVAPGATGKSLLALNIAIALATGAAGVVPYAVAETGRTWVINGEDDNTEMRRRLVAARRHFGIDPAKLKGQLFLTHPQGRSLLLATRKGDGLQPVRQTIESACSFIQRNGISCVVVDPLISLHDGSENDNAHMHVLLDTLRGIASRTGCAVLLVHHSGKPQAGADTLAGNAYAARGATSIITASRIAVTLCTMSEADALQYGVSPADRSRYARIDDAKANLTLASGEPRWLEKVSVKLPNGEGAGVFVPREMSRVDAAQSLAQDIVDALAGGPLSVTAVVDYLLSVPAGAGRKKGQLRDAIAAAFAGSNVRELAGKPVQFEPRGASGGLLSLINIA